VEAIAGPISVDPKTQSERAEFLSSENPTGPVPVVHPSMWAEPESSPVPSQSEPPRGDELQTMALAPMLPEKPAPNEEADVPWWLSEVPVQRAEVPIPLLWQDEKTGTSRKKETARLLPDPVEFSLHADPSRIQRGALPAQQSISQRSGSGSRDAGSKPPQHPIYLTDPENSPERLTSRLSGLRSLLTGLGLKEVHSSPGTLDAEDAQRTRQERETSTEQDSSRFSRSTVTDSPVIQDTATRSREVSAQPEFLKPTTTSPNHQVEDSKAEEKSLVRTFQVDTEAEEPTLPSRRGQYRNL
jgi:hypothetical protein